MEYSNFISNLHTAFDENGMANLVSDTAAKKLCDFANILIETNKSFNLTAITDENEIILKHFVDSASIIKHIPQNASVIDIGCGAGFPSLPLSILREDIECVAIDSTEKKINFINSTARQLDVKNISAKCIRAEDYAKEARESFDVATSRAVARLNILDELCIPFIKVGGFFVAMKSSRGSLELDEAKNGINILGARLNQQESLSFAYSNNKIEREIFVFEKTRSTPLKYPRNYSQISKKQL